MRVYERRFDYDEAKRLREEGLTYQQIASRFGVTDSAVYWAVNDGAREAMIARHGEWQRGGTCVDCGSPCSRNRSRRHERCHACASLARATSVRPNELRCRTCHEWKPDEGFPGGERPNGARRGRHGQCRSCLTEAKRAWRERNKVPCSHGCGAMVDGKNRSNPHKPPECKSCANRRTAAMNARANGRYVSRAA